MSAESLNIAAAMLRIMDADMAAELSELTRRTMLEQTGLVAASVSNYQPASVLSLIEQSIG